jgi:hypothetical protein
VRFVEPGVFNGAGDGGGEEGEGADVLVGEVVETGAFEVEDAEETVAEEEGDGDS